MDTNWSIEAGLDDPVIVIPWAEASSGPAQPLAYLDLKADPAAIDKIPEARAWPEVRQVLLILNAAESRVWTVKCDAWVLDEDERQLDFGPVQFGYGAYFDVFGDTFYSLSDMHFRVEDWAKQARSLPPEDARADFVLRPALWNGNDGFATTVYIFGYGQDECQARVNWSQACIAVARLMARVGTSIDGRYNRHAGE